MHIPSPIQAVRAGLLLALLLGFAGCGYIRYAIVTTPGDFSLAVAPATSTVALGAQAPAYSFTVTPIGNFAGTVTVALQPAAGFTCAPANCIVNAGSTLLLTPTATGTYTLNFVATSGTLTHAATATLTVTAAPDFTFAVTPTTSTIGAGTAVAYSFTATPLNGFNGAVSVAATAPAGFTCAPVSCTAALAAGLQLSPAAGTAAGTYTIPFTATSGALTHTATATVTITAAPDFSFTVTPATATTIAGTAAPAYTLTAQPLNGFTGTINVSSPPPSGFTCAPVSCNLTLTGSNPAVGTLTVTPALAGTFTLTFTATSGTITHTATASLTVTPMAIVTPPPTAVCAIAAATVAPAATRTGYVYTGDPSPNSVVYDARRNRILATNLQFNEIDIIAPDTMTISARLPVPQPMGIDLSADGTTIIIGTRTHYFYRATADTLCITDRQYLAKMPPLNFNLSPMIPVALADGSILFAVYDVATTAQSVYLWTAAGGFTQPANLGQIAYSVSVILPSADRMHAYISGDDSGGDYVRYDVGSGATFNQLAFGTQPRVLAVKQDGSQVLLTTNCCVTLTDRNFNTLATYKPASEAILAEPDFSKFYFLNSTGYITVTDSMLNPAGTLSVALTGNNNASYAFKGFDGEHRIVALTAGGVALLNIASAIPTTSATTSAPFFSTPGALYGAFTPANPQPGYSTQLNGAGFSPTPAVVLSQGNVTQAGSAISYVSTNVIDLTVPKFTSGCADVLATFTSGAQAFSPQAYCYTPSVFVVDGDSAPTTGGSTLTLYGLGFGTATKPTVTIGGIASSSVTQTFGYGATVEFAYSTLKVLVPPGPQGAADITITTPFGTTTLPHAFHYAQRTDIVLPIKANPVQLVLDAPRNRVLVTDSANNSLLVYGLASNTLVSTIPTGPSPQGIALTPDGTKLLLATAGDDKVSVLDANTYAVLQQVTVPSTGMTFFGSGPVGPPVLAATMTGNTAYILTQDGYLQGNAGAYSYSFLFDYNLTSNQLTADPINTQYYGGGSGYFVAASADGSTALVGTSISHSVGGALTAPDTTLGTYFDLALAPDAHTTASGSVLFDNTPRWQNSTSADAIIQPTIALGENFFYGAQFNGTGSLYYRPTATHIRIYDAQHGELVRTLEVPGGLVGSTGTQTTGPTRLLAVNPAGQQIIAATGAGVSIFTFAADPLSISEANKSAGQVTILGSEFAATSTITIDTVAATATFVSSTQLNVTLPANLAAGSHAVTVTNTNGDTYTLTLAFTTP